MCDYFTSLCAFSKNENNFWNSHLEEFHIVQRKLKKNNWKVFQYLMQQNGSKKVNSHYSGTRKYFVRINRSFFHTIKHPFSQTKYRDSISVLNYLVYSMWDNPHLPPFRSTYGKSDPFSLAQAQVLGSMQIPLQLHPAAALGRMTFFETWIELMYL